MTLSTWVLPRAFRALLVLLAVAAMTAAILPLEGHVSTLNPAFAYLLLVVAVSARWGAFGGVVAAAGAILALDYFFVPPTRALTIEDEVRDLVELALFLLIAVASSAWLARSRGRMTDAMLKEKESVLLYELATLIVSDLGSGAALASICARVRTAFGADSCAVLEGGPDGLAVLVADGASPVIAAIDRSCAEAALLAAGPAFVATNAGGSAGVVMVPLQVPGSLVGFLRVEGNWSVPWKSEAAQRLLRAFAQVTAIGLQHAELIEQATETRALQEADHLKSALMAAVSHELRTPLGSIKASVTGLLEPEHCWSPAEQAEFLATIDEEADRLTRIVSNLLDLSRIEGGVLRPTPDWYDLREFLETTLNGLSALTSGHWLGIQVDGDPEGYFDYVLLGQVLSNLVENATKYAPAGTAITVGVATSDRGLTITVTDQGPGVPMAERERVFERFYRSAVGSGAPGTGLGLAVSRGLVEAQGGTLTVRDADGGSGATFVIALPAPARIAPALPAEAVL